MSPIHYMDFKLQRPEFESGLQENLFYLGVCIILIMGMAAANNVMTSGEDVNVGPVEVYYDCVGLDLGVCLGIERAFHEVHNFDDWESPEEGSEDYYRVAEAELMLQAYRICEDKELEDMDWLEDAEHDNRTGEEWYEMEEINLLGCEDTFRFEVDE